MKKQITNYEIISKLEEIRELILQVFSGVLSESYKQKVVYDLLNIVQGGNKEKFLWVLLRLMNSKKGDSNTEKLMHLLNELYILSLSEDVFKKWAYTVIMEIMSVKTQQGGK